MKILIPILLAIITNTLTAQIEIPNTPPIDQTTVDLWIESGLEFNDFMSYIAPIDPRWNTIPWEFEYLDCPTFTFYMDYGIEEVRFINPETQTQTLLQQQPLRTIGNAVPEPSTYGLLGACALLVLIIFKKQKYRYA